MSVLESISQPADLRRLDGPRLAVLANEIRQFLVEAICQTGGHLGPNLGVVELTIALHRVFTSPYDALAWDTGHQAYVHKLLTGRRGHFTRLRQAGGLSGYPSRAESEHDLVENSHASTAMCYADGLSRAFRLRGEHDRTAVAVVGDGALTGGMCWEALNNIGADRDRSVVVVLNDNGRSYAPTLGGLADHLAGLRTGRGHGATLFEQLGFEYLGPVDGHDIAAMEVAFRHARDLRRPVIVHCVTTKGRGYRPAELDEADRLHAVGVIDPATGRATVQPGTTWTDVFGDELAELADRRADLVGITAAMLRPVGLHRFAAKWPDRVFDVGMAEQHAVTCAAGLALGGLHPVVAVYSTFLNRAFDQALMDVALHRLPVTFVLDRAGVTGEDGPSHHGMWDLSLFQLLPGIRIAAPRDAPTLREELREAVDVHDGPTLLRFPKATVDAPVPALDRLDGVDILRCDPHSDILIVSIGAMAPTCLQLAERLASHGVPAAVVDPRWVVPVTPALVRLAASHRHVVTVEDNGSTGGVGAAIAQALRELGARTTVDNVGLRQQFLAAGRRSDLLREQGLVPEALADRVLSRWCGAQPVAQSWHLQPAMATRG